MTWTLRDSGGFSANTASGGTSYTFPGGAASAGDLLIIGLSSDTILGATPAGWTVADSDVGNIGAYALYKVATGGETAVTITTSGDHPTAAGFLRYSGNTATPLDVIAQARSIVSNNTTPAVSTAALAGSGELALGIACLGGLQNVAQTNVAWTAGYTNLIDQTSGALGLTDQRVYMAANINAGPAAQSPNASWSGGATNNQTILVLTFVAAPTTPQVVLAASLTGTSGLAADLGPVEVTAAAALTATAGMTASLSVPTAGPADPIATPVAQQLLTCLQQQLSTLANPPAKIQLRVGSETGPLIGENVDECCAGLAWVRVANVYPSWDSFPSIDNTWLPTGPLAYAVVLEMGVAFCMPWSDSSDSFESFDPPSTADWATAFNTQMLHQTLMRRAAACCFLPTQRRAVGEWIPLAVEGGCTGGKLTVIVSVPAPCADC